MKKTYATLDDVARAVDMSRAQVSRALRGDPGVRAETRQLIQAKAKQLKYRPNLAARSLAEARSNNIGLMIGELSNPFHILQAQAVDDALRRQAYAPIVSLHPIEDAAAVPEAERLLQLRANAVILLGTPRSVSAIKAIAEQMPCVYLGSSLAKHPRLGVISTDDAEGVQQVMRYLFAHGHRRIAHISGASEASASDRTHYYVQWMQQAGLPTQIVRGQHDAISGWKGVDQLLATGSLPTAIFASNDQIACGALDRLKHLGIKVPQQISVIGFDGITDAASGLVSLSTVHQDVTAQARLAMQMLPMLMAGQSLPAPSQSTPLRFIPRQSSGPAPVLA